MYNIESKIVKNRSDQNKILKLWRICAGNLFSSLFATLLPIVCLFSFLSSLVFLVNVGSFFSSLPSHLYHVFSFISCLTLLSPLFSLFSSLFYLLSIPSIISFVSSLTLTLTPVGTVLLHAPTNGRCVRAPGFDLGAFLSSVLLYCLAMYFLVFSCLVSCCFAYVSALFSFPS